MYWWGVMFTTYGDVYLFHVCAGAAKLSSESRSYLFALRQHPHPASTPMITFKYIVPFENDNVNISINSSMFQVCII